MNAVFSQYFPIRAILSSCGIAISASIKKKDKGGIRWPAEKERSQTQELGQDDEGKFCIRTKDLRCMGGAF